MMGKVYINSEGETQFSGLSAAALGPEWSEVPDLPEDYDSNAVNYLVVDGEFVASNAAMLKAMRTRRDALIKASDYVEFSRRISEEQRTEGLAYRDLLFELPETTDPMDPDWPTPPAWLNLD